MEIKSETTKGTPVTITIEGTDSIDCTARVTCGKLVNEVLSRHTGGMTYPLDNPRDGATHYLRTCRNVGVGLSKTEAERIDREYKGWLDSLPGEVKSRLHSRRDYLADGIRTALDEVRYKRDRWFESECKRGPLADYEADECVVKARRELAEFDAAHPEIVAEIKARKAADAERHMWD